ncbi:MAG: hypothetical protein QOC98_3397 [Frankiaceae bacterium]|nr:hypothetical protein [Frankiaceae bacterium]
MKRAILAVAALLLSRAALGQQPAAPQPTPQVQFDAASTALASRDWAEALRLFEALEARVHDPRTLAIVRVREAKALTQLGRLDDAVAILRAELPRLPAADASLHDDRFEGLLALGAIAERRLDYDEALRQYRAAAAVPIPEIDTLPARRGIIQTSLFSDPDSALREADAALAVLAAGAPGNNQLKGAIETLRGRSLLNLGRFGDARSALDDAMRLLGGLTLRLDLVDLTARSDLALAAMLAGATEDARRYLAYTGAGRFSRGYLRLSATVDPPHCDGELAPTDVAVIQAAVADDGRVVSATPIYASRRGGSALAFARAVSDWSFDPESVATIPPFFRAAARFELRCSQFPNDDGYAEDATSVRKRMTARDPAWGPALERLRHLPLPQVRQELAAGGASVANSPAFLPQLVTLILSDSAADSERLTALRRALPLAAALPDPAPLLASLALRFGYESRSWHDKHLGRAPDYDALLAFPEIAASPRAAMEIRLARARNDFADNQDARALAAASAIRDLPSLAADDRLRSQATELIMAVRAAQGDLAAARAAQQAAGAMAPRCSYSRRKRIVTSENDFPQAALQWGFEGWAMGEIMIGSNGVPRSVRTIVAYPAFVFAEAEEHVVRTARFDPIFAPDDGVCPGSRLTIAFRLP